MSRREIAIYSLAILISLVGHVALFEGLGNAARSAPPPPRPIEMAIYTPPPPDPTPPPEVEKPKPKKVDLTKVKLPPPPETPPPPNTQEQPPTDEPPRPVFGISMSSTVGPGSGSGFKVQVGNTLMKEPDKEKVAPAEVKAYTAPLHQVQKMPKALTDCRSAAMEKLQFEGQVKLSVEILEDGSVGEVKVLSDFGEAKATALAMEAIRQCRFSPAEIAGKAVATIIPYKYTFQLE